MDPVTALAILDMALALGRMMAPDAGSPLDLQRAQTEMLKLLSDQIAVVHRGVVEILKNLEEIRKLIGGIPQAVVERLSLEQGVWAKLRQMQTMLAAYEEDREKHGISYADEGLNRNHELENQVLTPLREARYVLSNNPNAAVAPVLGTVLYSEVRCMILAHYRPSRIRAELHSYQATFTGIQTGCSKELKEIRTRRRDRHDNIKELHGSGCCIHKLDNADDSRHYRAYRLWTHWEDLQIYVPEPELYNQLAKDDNIGKLLATKVVTVEDLPQERTTADRIALNKDVEAGYAFDSELGNDYFWSSDLDLIPNKAAAWAIVNDPKWCNKPPYGVIPEIRRKRDEIEDELDNDAYRALILGCALTASEDALKSITKLLADPALKD